MRQRGNIAGGLVIACVLTIVHIVAVVRLSYEFFALLSLLYIPLRIAFFLRFRLLQHPCALIAQIAYEWSFLGWIAFWPMPLAFQHIPPGTIALSTGIGTLAISVFNLVFILLSLVAGPLRDGPVHAWTGVQSVVILPWYAVTWMVGFGFALLLAYLGLAAMGVEIHGGTLPFKLEGLMASTCIYGIPILAALFMDFFFEKKMRGMLAITVFLLFVFAVYESFTRMSKGALLMSVAPTILWCLYRRELNIRVFLFSAVCFFITVLGYGYVREARNLVYEGGVGVESVMSAYDDVASEAFDAEGFVPRTMINLYRVFSRAFHDGHYLSKFLNYSGEDMKGMQGEVLEAGNPGSFHTHVIDGFPFHIPHNSGSSLYADAYLMGGLPLILGTAILFSVIACVVDFGRLWIYTGTCYMQAALAFVFLFLVMEGPFTQIIFGNRLLALYLGLLLTGMIVFNFIVSPGLRSGSWRRRSGGALRGGSRS